LLGPIKALVMLSSLKANKFIAFSFGAFRIELISETGLGNLRWSVYFSYFWSDWL